MKAESMDQTANYQERWTSKGLWSAFDKDPASALQTVPTLAQVRGWIVERMESKRSRRLLFLGLDGIAYDAMFRMTADMLGVQLAPVLSTVPSTSTSAWTTILTGLPPEQHGIYGAAHHLPHLGTSVFLFDPVLRTADGDAPAALSRQDLNQRCPETIFHDLKSFGRAHALGFADDLSRNGLLDLWLHEAEVDWLADAYPLYENPERLTEHLIARARPLIEGGDSVFVYFNFDWHIHDFGVTPALARSVRSLLLAAQALCRAHPDLTVAMVSDLGLRAFHPLDRRRNPRRQPHAPRGRWTHPLLLPQARSRGAHATRPGRAIGRAGGGSGSRYLLCAILSVRAFRAGTRR
jgi:hypothetical protein